MSGLSSLFSRWNNWALVVNGWAEILAGSKVKVLFIKWCWFSNLTEDQTPADGLDSIIVNWAGEEAFARDVFQHSDEVPQA